MCKSIWSFHLQKFHFVHSNRLIRFRSPNTFEYFLIKKQLKSEKRQHTKYIYSKNDITQNPWQIISDRSISFHKKEFANQNDQNPCEQSSKR